MSRQPKMYFALAAVAALMAIVPATSSASYFGYEVGGDFSSEQLEPQELTFESGYKLKCSKAYGSGKTESYAPAQSIYLTVNYSGCTAFGLGWVKVSPVKYRYGADGTLDLRNQVTIDVALGGCSVVLSPQSNLGAVTYTNSGKSVVVENAVGGIAYTTAGSGICGSSGTDATLTGRNEMKLNGGYSRLWWEA
jgi:hypothetical protein